MDQSINSVDVLEHTFSENDVELTSSIFDTTTTRRSNLARGAFSNTAIGIYSQAVTTNGLLQSLSNSMN